MIAHKRLPRLCGWCMAELPEGNFHFDLIQGTTFDLIQGTTAMGEPAAGVAMRSKTERWCTTA